MKLRYSKEKSPLFKITSHRKLSNILGLSDIGTLKKIIAQGDSNYDKSTIKQKSNSLRQLEVPRPQLRRIHNRINNLLNRINIPSYLHSGVKKRSHITNVKSHINNNHVINMDIKSFYQAINKDKIFNFFYKDMECCKDISESLSVLCSCDKHIPTGSSLSQNMAFFCNKKMFDLIYNFSLKKGITFTCYVDDITISSDNIRSLDKEKIIKIIAHHGYKTHKYKNYTPQCKHKEITGVIIQNNTIKVKNKIKKQIKILHKEKDINYHKNGSEHESTIKSYQKLIGYIYSAAQINSNYKIYGALIVKERSLRKIKSLN